MRPRIDETRYAVKTATLETEITRQADTVQEVEEIVTHAMCDNEVWGIIIIKPKTNKHEKK